MRVYTPDGPGPFPAVLLIHGGAFWMGGGAAGFHLNDALCRQIAAETGAVAFNFDHRLAPEYPYPIPLEDISQALDWIVGRAAELKVDADRLALFGISSGANLVCAAGQRAASRGSPVLAGQVLQCPSLDLSPTSARFAGRLTDAANANLIAGAETIASYYAAGTDRHNPGVSPGLCPDLVGTPATLVVVAEYDHLADDGLSFARRLTSAGVPVTTRTYPMTHTIALPSVFRRMHHETMAWLRGVFND
jgi:acetyl esterase